VDWDNDGDNDLIVGEADGHVRYYKNIGTATNPSLHYVGQMTAGGAVIDVAGFSTPCVTDWNNDGLLDLLVGSVNGNIRLYLNVGAPGNPVLAEATLLNAAGVPLYVGTRSSPAVADFDGDGVLDLISGDSVGWLHYYHNISTATHPQLAASVYLYAGGLQINLWWTTRPTVVDWNLDGRMDLVVGDSEGLLKRYIQVDTIRPQPTITVNATNSTLIPASGGNLNYHVKVFNGTANPATIDAWSILKLSNSSFIDMLFRPGLSLAPGDSLVRNLTITVPATWSFGNYKYYAFVGDFNTKQAYSTDDINFGKAIVLDGPMVNEFSFTPWDDDKPCDRAAIPKSPEISASPNPFNPTTTLAFNLPTGGHVEVTIYNATGQKVATLVNGHRAAGHHQITWEAGGMPSGVYFACIQTPATQQIQKLLLLK
jgi:hypothetical protein